MKWALTNSVMQRTLREKRSPDEYARGSGEKTGNFEMKEVFTPSVQGQSEDRSGNQLEKKRKKRRVRL